MAVQFEESFRIPKQKSFSFGILESQEETTIKPLARKIPSLHNVGKNDWNPR